MFQDLSVSLVEIQQLPLSKEEGPPNGKKMSYRLNLEMKEPRHIKEEPEELWSSQKGEQLKEPVENSISLLTFVPVKSEDDTEKPQPSQLQQRKTEQIERGADGDNCGGSEASKLFDPERDKQPETEDNTGDSSEAETDDSADWRDTTDSAGDIKNKRRKTDANSICCSECGKIFKYKCQLKQHMRIHTGEKPFSCSECDKRFTQKCHLTQHVLVHIPQKLFSCTECGKRFNQKCHLTRHIKCHSHSSSYSGKIVRDRGLKPTNKKVHTGEKPFSCSCCNKRFITKVILIGHMRSHTGEKPFSCTVCGKKFSLKGNLTIHKSVHDTEKRFSCSVCGKKFTLKDNMIKHMIIHTGEKPFSCPDCGKRFTQRGNLTQHMFVHSGEKPFICSECGKKFTHKSNLRAHIGSHRGEKPFSCSECGKSFKFNHYLTLHMAHHRGEKPYGCNVCDRTFAWSSTLRRHKCVSQASKPLQNQTEVKKSKAETGADGEDCGGSKLSSISDPKTNMQSKTGVKTEDFSGPK